MTPDETAPPFHAPPAEDAERAHRRDMVLMDAHRRFRRRSRTRPR